MYEAILFNFLYECKVQNFPPTSLGLARVAAWLADPNKVKRPEADLSEATGEAPERSELYGVTRAAGELAEHPSVANYT